MPKSRSYSDTPEEAKERWMKVHLNRDRYEADVWGCSYDYTPEEAHELMYDRLPDYREFILPREIMERLDLTPNAKLVYAVINAFPTGRRWRMSEISGLTGLSCGNTAMALQLLEDRKLMARERDDSWNGKLPSKYTVIKEPSRFDHHMMPKFLQNDIGNIEDELKERFYGFGPESK